MPPGSTYVPRSTQNMKGSNMADQKTRVPVLFKGVDIPGWESCVWQISGEGYSCRVQRWKEAMVDYRNNSHPKGFSSLRRDIWHLSPLRNTTSIGSSTKCSVRGIPRTSILESTAKASLVYCRPPHLTQSPMAPWPTRRSCTAVPKKRNGKKRSISVSITRATR